MQVIRLVKVANWRQIQPFATNSFIYYFNKKTISVSREYQNLSSLRRWRCSELPLNEWINNNSINDASNAFDRLYARWIWVSGISSPTILFFTRSEIQFPWRIVVVCLERGADLHMAQPMPLPLTVSCSSKIQIGFYLYGTGSPG